MSAREAPDAPHHRALTMIKTMSSMSSTSVHFLKVKNVAAGHAERACAGSKRALPCLKGMRPRKSSPSGAVLGM